MSPRRRRRRTFRILHAPLHGNSATNSEIQQAFRREGVVGAVFTEAYRHGAYLKSRPRWRAVIGSGTRRNSRNTLVARDVAVVVRRWRKPLSSGVRKACEQSEPLKIAPERFITWSVDMLRGKPLATIGLHPNPAVRYAWDSDRAKKYRENMQVLVEVVMELREKYGDDLDIVIAGDLQYTKGDPIRKWSPRYVFDLLELNWVASGLDWIAYSEGLRLVSTEVIDPVRNGQDHPWIEAELERVK